MTDIDRTLQRIVDKLEKNEDKLDKFKEEYFSNDREFREKFYSSIKDLDNKLDISVKTLESEHYRMNNLLDEHIKGVATNSARLNDFEIVVKKVVSDTTPIIEKHKAKKLLEEETMKKWKKWGTILGVVTTLIGILTWLGVK